MYRVFGRIHAGLLSARGQGTVEYVALILLVALVMAGVVAAMKGFKTDQGKELGDVIIGKIKEAVRKVQFEGPNGSHSRVAVTPDRGYGGPRSSMPGESPCGPSYVLV